jgi:predicted dehydrogenase
VGVGRGQSFARGFGPRLGMELAALCDIGAAKLKEVGKELKVATYTDYARFLEHDLDAVVLANYFHEHAPYAIRALEAGKHVMSEVAACFTLAEGVALIEAVEKSRKIYMLAENYPFMAFNQEMRRLYREGVVGKFQYGEGEYLHPMSAKVTNMFSRGVNHWRNWIPATYYCTHSLGPVMYITDSRPVKVNAFIVPHDPADQQHFARTVRRNDEASCLMVRMDNGGIAKLLQYGLRGHGDFVRIHGSLGLMENLRSGQHNMLRVRREPYEKKTDEPVEKIYLPDFPEHHEEAQKATHGGGDFFTSYQFAQAIRTGKPPYFDVYRGVAMSIVGIQGWRSALNDSNTVEIPDFRKPEAREQYRHDDWNPAPARHKEGYPLPSILGDIKPTKKGLAFARKVWKETSMPF